MQLTGAVVLVVEAPHLCLPLSLIAESTLCYFELRGQSVSLRRKQGEGSHPSVWCGWKSWKPLDQGADVLRIYRRNIWNAKPHSVFFKWLNSEMALIHTTPHLIILMYNFLFVAVLSIHWLITSCCKEILWFDIIGKFVELTENEPCCYWAKGGQSKCKENSESKQTHSLASDGMALSHFPTILPDGSVHNHTNQVVVMTLRQTFQIWFDFTQRKKTNPLAFLTIYIILYMLTMIDLELCSRIVPLCQRKMTKIDWFETVETGHLSSNLVLVKA